MNLHPYSLGPSEYMRFVQEAHITGSKLPMSHAHLIFLRANLGHHRAMKKLAAKAPAAFGAKSTPAGANPDADSELTLHEYVAAMVRVAHARLQVGIFTRNHLVS